MVRVYSQTFLSPDAGSDMSQWNWSSDSANLNLLKEVNEVLRLVKNCENSLACAKWMVTKLPMGMWFFSLDMLIDFLQVFYKQHSSEVAVIQWKLS